MKAQRPNPKLRKVVDIKFCAKGRAILGKTYLVVQDNYTYWKIFVTNRPFMTVHCL
jgi:hypothetical protein